MAPFNMLQKNVLELFVPIEKIPQSLRGGSVAPTNPAFATFLRSKNKVSLAEQAATLEILMQDVDVALESPDLSTGSYLCSIQR